jgi:hypothetical protein
MTKTSSTVWYYNWTVPSNTNPNAQGIATSTIVATDLAGRTNETATNNTITIDSIAPIVTVFTATGITQTAALLTVTTNELATCKYASTTLSYAEMTEMATTTGVTTHTQPLTGLIAGTSYNYYVRCADASGNTMGTSEVVTFTTTSIAAPTITVVTPAASATLSGTSTLTFRTNAGATTDAYVSIDGAAWVAATTNANPGTYVLDTTDLTNGSHTLRVMDTVATVAGYSDYVTFLVSNGDGDAPAGLAITTADATVNSDYYTIGGTITADPNNVTIQVLNGSAVAGTVIITTGDTDWSAVVALPQNATTTFMARATDPSGNSALSTANATPGLQDVVIIEDENVGADGTAPLFVAQAPAAGTTGVSISPDNFYVSFDEALDPNTIGSSTVKLCLVSDESCTNPVDIGSPMLMEQGKMIRLGGPSVTLSYNTPYWIYVTAGVADLADNHITAHGSTTTSQFTTETAPVGSFMTDAPVMVKTSGAAGGGYPDGWEWVMTVTLPTNLNHTALKFGNWASGSNSLAAGDNMQYYSEQIADDDTGGLNHPIAITAADTYPTNLTITNDADSSRPGIQTNIHIQVKLPSSTPAGSYSTSYGVRAQ